MCVRVCPLETRGCVCTDGDSTPVRHASTPGRELSSDVQNAKRAAVIIQHLTGPCVALSMQLQATPSAPGVTPAPSSPAPGTPRVASNVAVPKLLKIVERCACAMHSLCVNGPAAAQRANRQLCASQSVAKVCHHTLGVLRAPAVATSSHPPPTSLVSTLTNLHALTTRGAGSHTTPTTTTTTPVSGGRRRREHARLDQENSPKVAAAVAASGGGDGGDGGKKRVNAGLPLSPKPAATKRAKLRGASPLSPAAALLVRQQLQRQRARQHQHQHQPLSPLTPSQA